MGSIQKPGNRSWEVSEKNFGYLELMIARAKGLKPEMECAKQWNLFRAGFRNSRKLMGRRSSMVGSSLRVSFINGGMF
jgi:hypothetical protein